ncbi:MAG: hypothetical protein QOH86_1650 [Sphingomonadales bacterium]|jgi:hypothetical protein|nr:hypothetical protein [Sphingomonadales bacterium]
MNLALSAHPNACPDTVKFVSVQIDRDRAGLQLWYVVEGDPSRLVVPPPQKPYRADGLWQTTCFELFLQDEGEGYREFNFSPSGQWAAYRFRAYREGREPLGLDSPPVIRSSPEPFGLLLSVSVRVEMGANARLGLSAIIEETEGRKSYWALAHPEGEPDFHHRDCFALELPPARFDTSPRT